MTQRTISHIYINLTHSNAQPLWANVLDSINFHFGKCYNVSCYFILFEIFEYFKNFFLNVCIYVDTHNLHEIEIYNVLNIFVILKFVKIYVLGGWRFNDIFQFFFQNWNANDIPLRITWHLGFHSMYRNESCWSIFYFISFILSLYFTVFLLYTIDTHIYLLFSVFSLKPLICKSKYK